LGRIGVNSYTNFGVGKSWEELELNPTPTQNWFKS